MTSVLPVDRPAATRLAAAVPVLFVRDVTAAAAFYAARLGFAIDYLHGEPPFYGAVSRDAACLHLRFVRRPNFAALAAREVALVVATIEVGDATALHDEFAGRGVDIAAPLTDQPWGGRDFHIRDPDGNRLAFVAFPGTARGPEG